MDDDSVREVRRRRVTAPPGGKYGTEVTGTGTTKAANKRQMADHKRQMSARIIKALRWLGVEPNGARVRLLLRELYSDNRLPSDDDMYAALMAAPWFPQRRKVRWQIGEAGWRTHT